MGRARAAGACEAGHRTTYAFTWHQYAPNGPHLYPVRAVQPPTGPPEGEVRQSPAYPERSHALITRMPPIPPSTPPHQTGWCRGRWFPLCHVSGCPRAATSASYTGEVPSLTKTRIAARHSFGAETAVADVSSSVESHSRWLPPKVRVAEGGGLGGGEGLSGFGRVPGPRPPAMRMHPVESRGRESGGGRRIWVPGAFPSVDHSGGNP
jgi:hypothetical protein